MKQGGVLGDLAWLVVVVVGSVLTATIYYLVVWPYEHLTMSKSEREERERKHLENLYRSGW